MTFDDQLSNGMVCEELEAPWEGLEQTDHAITVSGLATSVSVALSFTQQELQEFNRRMMLSAGNGRTGANVDISINSYVSELPFQADSRYRYLEYGARQVKSCA
jgi:hypothetical protein